MREKPLQIPVKDITLEARMQEGPRPGTYVLCHPHPLYGGDMENNVVSSLGKLLNDLGWSVIRFNFRGVGESGGEYRDQGEEVEDLLAVRDFLEHSRKGPVHIAAYSFGAWAALRASARGLKPASLILVSLPIDFMDCSGLKLPAVPAFLTAGDRDDICKPDSLRNWLDQHASAPDQVNLEILEHCDHFYGGCEQDLNNEIRKFLMSRLTAA
jgi:hypothetical protein